MIAAAAAAGSEEAVVAGDHDRRALLDGLPDRHWLDAATVVAHGSHQEAPDLRRNRIAARERVSGDTTWRFGEVRIPMLHWPRAGPGTASGVGAGRAGPGTRRRIEEMTRCPTAG